MSFSVDDLVASLSSNHIGQEALDLAALHAQLQQTLFHPTPTPRSAHAPPRTCTTPTAGAPAQRWSAHPEPQDDDADERMVEDLLASSGPGSPTSASAHFAFPPPSRGASLSGGFPHAHAHAQAHPYPGAAPAYELSHAHAHAFAASDPFFAAALQQQQQQHGAPPAGFFAHTGRPAPSSPFARAPAHPHAFAQAHGFQQPHAHGFAQAQAPAPMYAGYAL